jgi:hypothetical protein
MRLCKRLAINTINDMNSIIINDENTNTVKFWWFANCVILKITYE